MVDHRARCRVNRHYRSGAQALQTGQAVRMQTRSLRGGRLLGRRGAIAAGVVAISIVAAGCLPKPSSWTGSGTHVAFTGDSITYNTEHDALGDTNYHLTDALVAAGYAVASSDRIGSQCGGPCPAAPV